MKGIRLHIGIAAFSILSFTANAQVSFTIDTTSGCAPHTVNCTNTTHVSMDTTNATFYWYFEGPGDTIIDDSTYDASFTYNNPGNYEIRLAMYDSTMVYQGDSLLWTTVNATVAAADSASICSNDSIYLGSAFQNTAGTYIDTLTATNGCDSIVSTTLGVTTAPNAGISDTGAACTSDINFDVSTVLGGTPDGGGTWTDVDGAGLFGTSFSPLIAGAGVYNFIYVVTGVSPCVDDSATVTVTVSTFAFAGLAGANLSACILEDTVDVSTGLLLAGDSGGTWMDDDATGQLNGTIFNPSAAGIGSYNFTYVVLGTGACANDSTTVTVDVVSTPNAGADGALTACGDQLAVDLSTGLDGTQDPGGTWNDDDATGNLFFGFFNASGVGAGTYNFSYVASASGCADDFAVVAVTVIAAPNAGTSTTLSTCDTTTSIDLFSGLGGSPDTGGSWSDDDFTGALANSIFDPSIPEVGTYSFTYTVIGTPPCVNASTAVTVDVSNCVGIPELNMSSIKLYPNPSEGVFTLDFGSNSIEDTRIEVFNALGELLENAIIENNASKIYVDLTGNPNGLYYLNIISDGKLVTNKVSITR